MALFKPTDFSSIELTISEAEKKTCGEIVVSIIPRSHDYLWVSGLLGFLLASVATVLAWFWVEDLTVVRLLELQLPAILLGFALGFIPTLRRVLTPSRLKARWVHRESLAYFSGAGVHLTRERAGILILVSETERRIEILADQGIHQRLGPDYWKEEVSTFVQKLSTDRPVEALRQVVREVGEKLAEHFPPDPENPNQLSDRIVTPK